MTIRLQDIADDLNLSKMTISKVLRGQTDVSAETKARVLKRVEELNYRPNLSARSLRTGQSYTVGLVVPQLQDATMAATCSSLIRGMREAGYAVLVTTSEGDPETEEREVERQISRQVDALFLYGSDAMTVPAANGSARDIPVIYLGRKPSTAAAFCVGVREADVGRVAANHLLSSGARRVAYLRGPRTAVADQRFSGFLEAHRQADLAPRLDLVVEMRTGANEYDSGFDAMRRLLMAKKAPDAVLTYTDALGAGARDAALALGLSLPGQFQVIGAGNDTRVCTIGMPLSSVDLAAEEIGSRAARTALRAIQQRGKDTPRTITAAPLVVPRSTTRMTEPAVRRDRKGT